MVATSYVKPHLMGLPHWSLRRSPSQWTVSVTSNSLSPGRCGCDFKYVDFKHKLGLISRIFKEILLLPWRGNERDCVSDHQPFDCLLNCLFRHRSNNTSKLRVTGLCEGNSLVTGEFPAQKASNAENVSIWWRHHHRIVSQGASCVLRHHWFRQCYHYLRHSWPRSPTSYAWHHNEWTRWIITTEWSVFLSSSLLVLLSKCYSCSDILTNVGSLLFIVIHFKNGMTNRKNK